MQILQQTIYKLTLKTCKTVFFKSISLKREASLGKELSLSLMVFQLPLMVKWQYDTQSTATL